MLEHALAQVAQQRGVERLELVLAPHGFDPDPWPQCGTVHGWCRSRDVGWCSVTCSTRPWQRPVATSC